MANAAAKKTWAKVAFGDVVRLSKERSKEPQRDGFDRYIGLEHLEPGDLKVRSWGNISDGVTFTNVFRPGQVLFGKRRAYQRKVAVADFSGVCSGDIYVFEPKGKDILPELLPFICQTDAFFEHAVGTSAGSLSPRTNWKSLADFEFALPPLEEQRRIAEILQAVDNECKKLVQTPHPRATDARSRGIKFPISYWLSHCCRCSPVPCLMGLQCQDSAKAVPLLSVTGDRPSQPGERCRNRRPGFAHPL